MSDKYKNKKNLSLVVVLVCGNTLRERVSRPDEMGCNQAGA